VSEAERFCEHAPAEAPQVVVDAVEIWAGGEPTGIERLRPPPPAEPPPARVHKTVPPHSQPTSSSLIAPTARGVVLYSPLIRS
jgi:hypothetical protein